MDSDYKRSIKKKANKVLSLSVLFIVYYLFLILLGVGLFAVTLGLTVLLLLNYYVLFESIQLDIFVILLLVGLWVMCYKLGWFLIKPLFIFPDTSDDNRVEITEEDAPQLFAMISEIAASTGNKMPGHVYLTPEANASVFYDSISIWSIFFPSEKNLAVGVGLLKGLNQSELKAILSHEYGHFSQEAMREGTISYRLLIIIREMVKFAQDEFEQDAVAQSSGNYKGYLHFAVIPISWITKLTTRFYNYIEKCNRSLSRYMEFEADAVACKNAGSTAHISALYKSSELDSRINLFQNFLFHLMEEGHWCKDFYQGYSLLFDKYAKEVKVNISPEELLTSPVGEASRFPSRIEKEDTWSTHPSTKDRVRNAELLRSKDEKINYDPAYKILDLSVINRAGERYQRNIALDDSNEIRWDGLTSYDETQMSKWIDKSWVDHILPFFMNPFLETKIIPFQLRKTSEENAAVIENPFTQENRDIILEFRQAYEDWQTLHGIDSKEAKINGFFYCDKQYFDTSSPIAVHKTYVEGLYAKKTKVDEDIYCYLMQQIGNKEKLNTMYWMIFFAQTEMDTLEPLENKAAEISQQYSNLENKGGDVYGVSVNNDIKSWLNTNVLRYLSGFDFDTVGCLFGEWKVDEKTTVSQELADWKNFMNISENYEYSDKYIIGIIHSIWVLLQYIYTVADRDWQGMVIDVYNQHKKQTN